jgi:hypothetical protein
MGSGLSIDLYMGLMFVPATGYFHFREFRDGNSRRPESRVSKVPLVELISSGELVVHQVECTR